MKEDDKECVRVCVCGIGMLHIISIRCGEGRKEKIQLFSIVLVFI